ncbi:MAG: hypothetical protein IJV02_06810 [Candidatus Methanomethylophilaceae archaeon]|nr:hypothetical protein [Candidatus Methanomethylophilaceae archaeon]
MQDWQIAVLNSEYLRADQDRSTGYRLVIRRTNKKDSIAVQKIVATVKHSNRKPVIICPDDPMKGMFAPKKEVLEVLMSREDYQEFRMWLAEAKMSGVM